MRQSRERVWSSSLELEALEQEVMKHSPDRPQGPRGHSCRRRADHECPNSVCESVPACGCICKCVRGPASVSLCRGESGLSVSMRGRGCECACVYVCVCVCARACLRPARKCLSVCMCLCGQKHACVCLHVCMHVVWGVGEGSR